MLQYRASNNFNGYQDLLVLKAEENYVYKIVPNRRWCCPALAIIRIVLIRLSVSIYLFFPFKVSIHLQLTSTYIYIT